MYIGYARGTWTLDRIAGHGRPHNMHQNCIVSMLARQKACSATTRILQGFAQAQVQREHLVVLLRCKSTNNWLSHGLPIMSWSSRSTRTCPGEVWGLDLSINAFKSLMSVRGISSTRRGGNVYRARALNRECGRFDRKGAMKDTPLIVVGFWRLTAFRMQEHEATAW